MSTIAFIGLGQMGLPMASNLIKKGETLRVFDINKQAIEALVKLGAYGASSAVDAAKGADFVITMLPNGDLVKSVLFGEQGICDALSTDALFIDMSTIHPLQSDAIAKELAHRNIRFMDAPVGRTSDHAISGNLLILAGGKDDDVKKAEPILMKMGNEMIKAGGLGMGIRLKIINNFMSIALNTLSAEAAVLCEALGLSLTTAIEMMSNTPAGKGHFSTTWPNKVLKGDLTPSFMIELAHKDIGIALDVANQLHVPMPMGAASREVYNQAKATGRAKQDWSAILQHVREISGYSK